MDTPCTRLNYLIMIMSFQFRRSSSLSSLHIVQMRVLLFFLLATIGHASPGAFNPSRLALIQRSNSTGNFLFRSGMILSSSLHHFAYDNITATMKARAAAAGFKFPDNVYIVDYSLLSDVPFTSEAKVVAIERKFFKEHKTKGEFHLHSIHGDKHPPSYYPAALRKEMSLTLNTWNRDHMPSFMHTLHTALETKHPQGPVAILVHCSAGRDRTGAVSGSFYMKYMRMSFREAVAVDSKVANCKYGCAPAHYNMNGLIWYCSYMYYKGQGNTGGCALN